MLSPELARIAQETGYSNLKSMYFLHNLVKNINPDCVLELGTYLGGSAAYMASAIKEGGVVVSIDSRGQLSLMKLDLDVPNRNIELCGLTDKLFFVEGSTFCVSELLVGFPMKPEIVFMDASHDLEGLWKEYRSLAPLLPENHVIVIDDIWPEVCEFVFQLLKQYPFCLTIKDFHQGMAVLCTHSEYLTKISDAIRDAHD